MNRIARLLLVFVFASLCLQLSGAGKRSIHSDGLIDNLPHSDVNCVVQDNRGYMWIATYGGLCKWDGYRLTTFNASNSEISSERVISLLATEDNLLYIGTESGGINVYDDAKGVFLPVVYEREFTDDVVYDIFQGNDGVVYACHNNLLSRLVFNAGSVNVETVHRFPRTLVASCGIAFDDSSVLVGIGSSIYRIDSSTGAVMTFKDVRGQDRFRRLSRAASGDILASSLFGVFIVEKGTMSIERLSSLETYCAVEASNGHVFVGTARDGIYELDSSDGHVLFHYVSMPFRSDMLSSSEISSIYEDRSGMLWIGTIGGGINAMELFDNNIRRYTQTEGLSQNRVITFGECGPRGWLWVTLHDGGTDIMNTADGSFRRLEIINASGEKDPVLSSFHTMGNGDLLIGTWAHGVWRIKAEELKAIESTSSEVIRLHADCFGDQKLAGTSVYCFLEDADGVLWISTSTGLYAYDPSTSISKEFHNDSSNYNSLCSDFVTDLAESRMADGRCIWVGTRLGLNRMEMMSDGSIVCHRVDIGDSGRSKFISSIHLSASGDIWVATLGDGLYRLPASSLEYEDFIFEKIAPGGDGFENEELESLLEDSDGNLWIGGLGISCYNPDSGETHNYTIKDNLQGNSFKIWAAYRMKDGRLVFGGPDGFNIIDPERIQARTFVPPTIITDVSVNGNAVPVALEDPLKYSENNLTISFSSLCYNNPEYNSYRYMLSGFDKGWHTISGLDPKAVYSNLPAGSYGFEVYGCSPDGVWSESPATLSFSIRPHPLKSPLAVVLYVLLALCVIGLVIRFNYRRIAEKNERRAEQEKLRLFTDLAHEIKTPLSLISAPVQELLESPSIGQSTRSRLSIVDKSTSQLQSLVEQILDLQKYEDNMMNLSVSEIDMARFLTETAYLYQPLASSRKITFRTEIPDSPIMVFVDKPKIERVIANLLTNAFKYTPAEGCVVLRLSEDSRTVTFSVEDNGPGIAEDERQRIFDRFYQGHEGQYSGGGTGIGLSLSKHIVDHHGGTIWVESRPNFGSKFSVRLQKGRSNFSKEQINDSYSNSDNLINYEHLDPVYETRSSEEKSATILVVDDNAQLREYLHALLSPKYNVLCAADGMEAYEIAIAEQPDLILSDVMMPNMTGTELCQRIKNNDATSHILVLLLTARNLVSTEIESWQVGADGFVTKPFHISTLLSRIENLISGRDRLRRIFRNTINVEPSEITIVSSDEKLIKRLLDAIEARMKDPEFGVDALSEEVGISKAQLYRKITSITGLSTVQFIRSIRLKRAAQLLLQDSSSVSTIMYKVGFNNASYFSKIFKEEFGCLPKEYAQKRNC